MRTRRRTALFVLVSGTALVASMVPGASAAGRSRLAASAAPYARPANYVRAAGRWAPPTPVDDTVRLPVRAPVAAGPGTPARAATRTGTATGTATAGRHASRTSAAMSTQRGHQPGEPAAPYPGGPDATTTAGYSSPHVHDRIPPADPGAAAVDPVPASGGIAAGTQRRPRAAAIRPTVRPD